MIAGLTAGQTEIMLTIERFISRTLKKQRWRDRRILGGTTREDLLKLSSVALSASVKACSAHGRRAPPKTSSLSCKTAAPGAANPMSPGIKVKLSQRDIER